MKGDAKIYWASFLLMVLGIFLISYAGIGKLVDVIYVPFLVFIFWLISSGIGQLLKGNGKAVENPEDGDYVIIVWPNVVTLYEKFHRTYWEIRRYDKEKTENDPVFSVQFLVKGPQGEIFLELLEQNIPSEFWDLLVPDSLIILNDGKIEDLYELGCY